MHGEKFERLFGQKCFAFHGGFNYGGRATRRQISLEIKSHAATTLFSIHQPAHPWQGLVELLEPYEPKQDGRGRLTKPLLWMMKFYFLQSWFDPCDPQIEE
jgi:hypothetical protein